MALATDAKSPGSPSLSPFRLLARVGPTGLIALILAILIAVPILAVFVQSAASTGDLWRHMIGTVLADYVVNTLILLAIVGAVTSVTGVACAWTVTMHEFPGAGFCNGCCCCRWRCPPMCWPTPTPISCNSPGRCKARCAI